MIGLWSMCRNMYCFSHNSGKLEHLMKVSFSFWSPSGFWNCPIEIARHQLNILLQESVLNLEANSLLQTCLIVISAANKFWSFSKMFNQVKFYIFFLHHFTGHIGLIYIIPFFLLVFMLIFVSFKCLFIIFFLLVIIFLSPLVKVKRVYLGF